MILTKEVKVRWSGSNKKHFIDLGYKFTKTNDMFLAKVEHLTLGSNSIIEAKCDYCGKVFKKEYQYLNRSNKIVQKHSCGSSICTKNKTKESCMLKYGVDNYFKSEEFKNKYKQNSKYTIYDVKKSFEDKGYILISTEYVNSKEKLKYICKKHRDEGIQEISYNKINIGHGCKFCGIEKCAKSNTISQDKAIENMRLVHGDKYDYSKFEYVNNSTNGIIICSTHGEFSQSYKSHISGSGCPKCAIEDSGWSRTNWLNKAKKSNNFKSYKVYKIRCWNDFEEFYKIGITFLNITKRFKGSDLPYNYEVIEIIKSDSAEYIWDLEKELHKKHKEFQYTPKLSFGGMTECFSKLI